MKKIIAVFLASALFLSAGFSQEAQESNGTKEEKNLEVDAKSIGAEVNSLAAEEKPLGLEFYTGYGFLTSNTLVLGFTSVFGEIVGSIATSIAESGKNSEENKDKSKNEDKDSFQDYGVFQLGVNYYFNDYFYSGLMGTFEQFTITGDTPISTISVLANAGVQYGWEKAKFYHELGAGVLFMASPSDTSTTFAMNATLVGFKFNPAGNFWLFTEICAGQKGLANIGARWKI